MFTKILETVVRYLSDAITWIVDGAGDSKHILTAFWIVLRYEAELRELAAKSDNDLDDKVVEEIIEAARKYWPHGAQAELELPPDVQ